MFEVTVEDSTVLLVAHTGMPIEGSSFCFELNADCESFAQLIAHHLNTEFDRRIIATRKMEYERGRVDGKREAFALRDGVTAPEVPDFEADLEG